MDGPRKRGRLAAALLAAGLLALLGARPAAAQSGVVAGTVVSSAGARPVADAQVSVRGRREGAVSDTAGRFRITGLPTSGQVTLEVRRLGYRPTSQSATIGATDLRLELAEQSVQLNSVVVTGVAAGTTTKRELGVDLSQIDAAELVQRVPVPNVQNLLNARAPGVTVLQNSGMVGSGATVRIRGSSSLALSNQPLIYVDGTRVDNAQGTGPTNQAFGASTTSRWNDIDPNEIESIEIVKGPAATTLYGTEAANGVIQIITKKGKAGAPSWQLHAKEGVNQFADQGGRIWTNYGQDPVSGQVVGVNIAQRQEDAGDPIFTNGPIHNYNLGLNGGTSLFQYNVNGGWMREQGAQPDNWTRNVSSRANVRITPSEKIDLNAALGYVSGRTALPYEAGGGGATWATYFSSPTFQDSLNGQNGFRTAPPFRYRNQYALWQDIGRFTGSVQLNHRPTTWFAQRIIAGLDQGSEYGEELATVHPELSHFFGTDADSGFVFIDTRGNRLWNMNYSGTATLRPMSGLSSGTSFGLDFYSRTTRYTHLEGFDFPAPGLKSLSSTTAGKTASENEVQNNTVGLYVQEQLGWRDRLFVTGAVRVDNNSSFGSNFKKVYYPKVSASWVASEEPFFHVPWVTSLKLRAAYGQSGQAPLPYSAVPYYTASSGYNGTAAITPASRGNPDLGPERGYETELGFDAGFLSDRAGIEFTYFTGGTRNAIVERQVPPSVGYPGTQFVNAGRITRNGVEMTIRGTPWQSAERGLDLAFNFGTNNTNVDDLGGAQFIQIGTYNRHEVGFPLGAWFGKRVVDATVDYSTGDVADVMCDDGKGGKVLCSSAPDVYLGRSLPNIEGAFNGTLNLSRNLSVSSTVDFKRGYKKLDGNARVRCHLFDLCKANYLPEGYSPAYLGAISSSSFASDLINDASYAKLRELSITYALPTHLAGAVRASRAAITLSGRNLHTWTNYTGLEPEASFQGGSRGGFGQWEQNVTPQLRQWIVMLNLAF